MTVFEDLFSWVQNIVIFPDSLSAMLAIEKSGQTGAELGQVTLTASQIVKLWTDGLNLARPL